MFGGMAPLLFVLITSSDPVPGLYVSTNGAVYTSISYDRRGLLVLAQQYQYRMLKTDDRGDVVETVYYSVGPVGTGTKGRGNVWHVTWDTRGRVVDDPGNAIGSYQYSRGRLIGHYGYPGWVWGSGVFPDNHTFSKLDPFR